VHDLLFAGVGEVAIPEGDSFVLETEDPRVRDRAPMGVGAPRGTWLAFDNRCSPPRSRERLPPSNISVVHPRIRSSTRSCSRTSRPFWLKRPHGTAVCLASSNENFAGSWNVACSAMASAAFAAKTVAMISLSHSRVSRGGSVRHAAGVAWRTLPLVVDRVLPEVPTRQWVLTLPIPLRYRIL